MQHFKADMHIHTVLSPCGDLEMGPVNIIKAAVRQNLDIIGITDHNSTLNAALIKKMAEENGIFTLCGAEVTTKEEVHCLTFFENIESLEEFQQYLEQYLPDVKNDPSRFGYQVVVDQDEMIIKQVDTLLIPGINQTIDQVERKVHELNGLFIPAHIDRPKYSLISQLGFVPKDLKADALEISRFTSPEKMIEKFPYLDEFSFISNSDAHYPENIGENYCYFQLESLSFQEIRMALGKKGNRRVSVLNNENK